MSRKAHDDPGNRPNPSPAKLLTTTLRAECSSCLGLCCVFPGFVKSAQFPANKPPGRACPNLDPNYHCSVHNQLRVLGYTGCTVYDCFGAGQLLCRDILPETTWRTGPEVLSAMATAFSGLRDICELTWHTASALQLLRDTTVATTDPDLVASLRSHLRHLLAVSRQSLRELLRSDLPREWSETATLLDRTSRIVRGAGPDLRRVDLAGKDLRRRNLMGANLRGANLIAADLRGVDLSRSDLLGIDLRDADVRGAHLHAALFLTNAVVAAARGDSTTTLPAHLLRPAHWA